MAKLIGVTETITRVEYYNLDSFIQEVTGQKDYECVSNEEWNNDSSHRFNVVGELWHYDQKFWEEFKAGKASPSFRLGTILEGLCVDKQIPAGIYLIRASW